MRLNYKTLEPYLAPATMKSNKQKIEFVEDTDTVDNMRIFSAADGRVNLPAIAPFY